MSLHDQGEVKPNIPKSTDSGGSKNKKKGRFRGQHGCYITPRFKGDTEASHGQIYDASRNDQAELFTKTTKKLASYTRQIYKEPQDIQRAIKDFANIVIPMPKERTTIINKKLRDKLYKKDLEV